MSIKDDFKSYIDAYGLVVPKKGESSGNGLLYTAEYIVLLALNDSLNSTDKTTLSKVYQACQKEPGLMMRSPVGGAQWKDQEGPDDYFGAATSSYFLGDSLAADILKYGRTHKASLWGFIPVPYVYNNVDPGTLTSSAFMGRMQNLICHLQFAAGENPPLWRKLWWCATILGGAHAKPDHSDSWIMSWMCIKTMDGRSWLCSLAASYWRRRLSKAFPNGMSDVFANYFGKDHPMVKWSAGK